MLGDGSIGSASADAKAALRNWLLGGGRLFLGSPEALAAATATELLPLSPTIKEVGADLPWWQKNASLKPDDVLAEKNHRPVYARLRLGFGQVVFLFPASNPGDADGAAVFNRPDLQRVREKLPDLRIQPDRFAAFTPGIVGEVRNGSIAR